MKKYYKIIKITIVIIFSFSKNYYSYSQDLIKPFSIGCEIKNIVFDYGLYGKFKKNKNAFQIKILYPNIQIVPHGKIYNIKGYTIGTEYDYYLKSNKNSVFYFIGFYSKNIHSDFTTYHGEYEGYNYSLKANDIIFETGVGYNWKLFKNFELSLFTGFQLIKTKHTISNVQIEYLAKYYPAINTSDRIDKRNYFIPTLNVSFGYLF